MSERDDLAADIRRFQDPDAFQWVDRVPMAGLVSYLLAAGWSRPRWVTTAAELDSLDWPVVVVGDGWADLISEGEDPELVDFPCLVYTIPAWSPPVESGETQGGGR